MERSGDFEGNLDCLISDRIALGMKSAAHYAGYAMSKSEWAKQIVTEIEDSELRGVLEGVLEEFRILDEEDATSFSYCRAVVKRGDHWYSHCGNGAAHISWSTYGSSAPIIQFPLCPQHARILEDAIANWVVHNRPQFMEDHGYLSKGMGTKWLERIDKLESDNGALAAVNEKLKSDLATLQMTLYADGDDEPIRMVRHEQPCAS